MFFREKYKYGLMYNHFIVIESNAMPSKEQSSRANELSPQVTEILGYLNEGRIMNIADVRQKLGSSDEVQLLLSSGDPNEASCTWKTVSSADFSKALKESENQNDTSRAGGKGLLERIAQTVIYNLTNPRSN